METCIATDSVRILGLGNDLLGDDAFGLIVARAVGARLGRRVDVVETIESGFRLLDHLDGARRAIVVDTVQTGRARPGTLFVAQEDDVDRLPGASPHYVGLFEALEAGRTLGLDLPDRVTVVAVEANDCRTVGGEMHPVIRGAIPAAIREIEKVVEGDA